MKSRFFSVSAAWLTVALGCLALLGFSLYTGEYVLLAPIILLPIYLMAKKPEGILILVFLSLLVKDIELVPGSEKTIGLKLAYLLVPLFFLWLVSFKRYRLVWLNIFYPLVMWAVFYIASTLATYEQSAAVYLFSILGTIASAYVAFLIIIQSDDYSRLIGKIFDWIAKSSIILAVAGIILAILSIESFIANPATFRRIAAIAFHDPNFFANLICMLMFYTWSLIKVENESKNQLVLLVALSVQCMMLFATFSRGAMAAIILTPFFFALIFQKWPFRLRLKTYLAMAVLAFVIFIGLYNLYQTNMKFEAFINFFAGRITNVGKEKSATSRLDFMEMGSAMADDNLFGHGPKQFIWQTINYSYINRTSRGFAPHNDYVALLVDSGIFGLFFWLLFVALLLRSARARLQSLHTENPRYWYLTAAILSFLVFLLQGLTLDLFYSPHVWLNISIMLALIYGEYFEKREIGRC